MSSPQLWTTYLVIEMSCNMKNVSPFELKGIFILLFVKNEFASKDLDSKASSYVDANFAAKRQV